MKELLTSGVCRMMVVICNIMLLAQLVAAIPDVDEALHRIVLDTAGAKLPQNGSIGRREPYRTGFHFQPKRNWMNDPNAPFFYKGWYHLFYQYNPKGAYWGNIIWGHAVSKDLVHWRYLEPALNADHWYDVKGVWSGSATFLEDGTPVLVYTGWSNGTEQVQNMAFPEDPGDPFLRKWVKHPCNPILVTPDGYMSSQFRDPSTAWKGEDGLWRMIVGALKDPGHGSLGVALLFKSSNFVAWNSTSTPLYTVETTGMWECPDFFPVHESLMQGLETSTRGAHVKHVLKVSVDSWKHDYYSVGTYNRTTDTYKPEINSAMEPGIGMRYDYGKFYASKTFFDPAKNRRILWGWVNESCSIADDIAKGWSSVMSLPRRIWLGSGTAIGNLIIQWPIDEILMLRKDEVTLKNVSLEPGSTLQLNDVKGVQLDIEVLFAMPELEKRNYHSNQELAPEHLFYESGQLRCNELSSTPHSSEQFGPFGLYVLASEDMVERTAILFHLVYFQDLGWQTLICSDQSNSTLTEGADKTTYGSYVHVAEHGQALSLRVVVDHSIVESFAQGGRTVVTSRAYPQFLTHSRATSAARVFLFNNAVGEVVVKSISAWRVDDIKRRDI